MSSMTITTPSAATLPAPAPPSGAPVLRLHHVTKRYGSARGVDDLEFSIAPGEVFGFIGPNGAGKTTTIRLALDLIRPTAGRIELFGRPPGLPEARRRVGYVPGDLRLYDRMTGREHARHFASLRGMRGTGDAIALAERLELDLDRRVHDLSRGNRQKVGLVLALMHRPDLLVLDEPTSGLDPLVQQTFADLMRETARHGRTVFLSSHVLSEVQQVADRVGVLREGRLVVVESVETLRSRAFVRVEAAFASPPPSEAFAGIAGVRELERHGATVLFALEGEIDPLLKRLAAYHVRALDSHEADLEDLFLALYAREAGDAR
jgi:beta-exotoxin I transport system ATP-binding protein